MPADYQGGTTVTVLFTQASATTGGENTSYLNLERVYWCSNVGVAACDFYRAFVGGGSIRWSLYKSGIKSLFHSLFTTMVERTNANSYDIFVTKNGQFRPGSVGV